MMYTREHPHLDSNTCFYKGNPYFSISFALQTLEPSSKLVVKHQNLHTPNISIISKPNRNALSLESQLAAKHYNLQSPKLAFAFQNIELQFPNLQKTDEFQNKTLSFTHVHVNGNLGPLHDQERSYSRIKILTIHIHIYLYLLIKSRKPLYRGSMKSLEVAAFF